MKNTAASVLARLRNISKSSGAPFQQVLQQYAIERFLYRISKSTHARGVVLKGALLLKTIGIQGARPTMDIDMLRKGKADQASLVALVKDCATLEVEPDGLIYIADSAVAEEITKVSEYKGTRIRMDARIDNVRLKIQIDFGVGDIMVPGPRMIEYPVLVGSDTIRLQDFYDVWTYSNHLDFNTDTLLKAIDATFKNRETPVPAREFEALSRRFAEQHRVQWNAFVKKIGEHDLTDAFVKVVEKIETFATPLLRSLAQRETLSQQWKAGNGWAG
jgi:Nucleotidyl transferase AbiEii toxin, Type IV TA system